MWQKRFAFRGPLPLVKCVAVWMPMLTHTQASHTDALKTHFPQIFSATLLENYKSGIDFLTQTNCFSPVLLQTFPRTISQNLLLYKIEI